jgi:PAS domain S-box-containing protein
MTIKNNRPEQAAPFSADMTGAPQTNSLRLSQVQAETVLRRQADEIARENVALTLENPKALSLEKTRQTLHELRVHQIELEMQNDELRLAQVEIDATRARYFDLYDMAPVGYCTLSEKGLIQEANLTAATMLGLARATLINQQLSRFIFKEDQYIYYLHRKLLFDTGKPQASDLRMVKNDGTAFWAHLESTEAQNADGIPVWRFVMSDITNRKLAEAVLQRTHNELEQRTEALLESEKHYRELVEGTPGIIYSFSIKRGGVYYSSHVTDILGYSPEQLYAQPMLWYNSIHPDERYSVDQLIRDATTCKPFCIEYRIRDALGNWHWFEDRSTGYRFDGIDAIVEGLVLDITERKRAEEALRDAHWRLDSIIEGTHVGTWEWNVETGETVFNETWAQIIGYTLAELAPISIETWESFSHPDDLKQCTEMLERHFAGELPYYDSECRMKHKNGDWVWIHDRGRVITRTSDDKPQMMFGTHTDITERKRAEKALRESDKSLRASLEEKDVLLKEVHHRVKNNLAAIMGLIDLQGQSDDEQTRAAMAELSNRIRSMSLVHEQLYRSENFARIDFQDYLNMLAAHLHSSYHRSGNIHVSVAASGVKMGLDSAVPCGLLITELVTNAFKYAFPAGQTCSGTSGCEIAVSAEWDGAAYTLTVSDNGVGLPDGLDWTKTKTMGLLLVKMLGQHQLRGKIEVDCTCGTTFRLRFVPKIVCIYE